MQNCKHFLAHQSRIAFIHTKSAAAKFQDLKPHVSGPIPGQRAQSLVKKLDRVFDTRSLNMVIDYEKSNGN